MFQEKTMITVNQVKQFNSGDLKPEHSEYEGGRPTPVPQS
jgi:hypothetical protein